MYFNNLEPDRAKLSGIMKILKTVLQRRDPENRLSILIVRGPVGSGKTILLNILCRLRETIIMPGHMINTRPLYSNRTSWRMNFDTTHFVKVTDLSSYSDRTGAVIPGGNSLAILQELSGRDHQRVYNEITRKVDSRPPLFWFIMCETVAADNHGDRQISVPITMENRILYLDLTRTLAIDKAARGPIFDSIDRMDMNLVEQYILNFG